MLPSAVNYLVLLLGAVLHMTQVTGDCQFPDSLQGKEYVIAQDVAVNEPELMHYFSNTTEHRKTPEKGLQPETVQTWTCMDLLEVQGDYYYFSEEKKGEKACVAELTAAGPEVLLHRQVPAAGDGTATNCQNVLQENLSEPARWYTKYPVSAKGIDCSILDDGTYPLSLSLDGTQMLCEGDSSSTATVDGDKITFSSCHDTPAGGYETPMNMELICLGEVAEDKFTSGNGAGKLLLLGTFVRDGAGSHLEMYSVRYRVLDNSVQMSLDISNATVPLCRSTQTYQSASPGQYVALIIDTSPQCDPACENDTICLDVNGVPTCIDPCASAPCQNNASCSVHDSGHACECVPGYAGDNCQSVVGGDDDDGDDDTTLLVVLLVCLAVIVIGIILLALCICERRRREEKRVREFEKMQSGGTMSTVLSEQQTWKEGPSGDSVNGGSTVWNSDSQVITMNKGDTIVATF